MNNYNVTVAYNDRVWEEVPVEADSDKDAEFEARNIIMDHNPGAHDVDVISCEVV